MKKVIFISSTGGHLHELLNLESLFNLYDYYIITEKDKSTKYLKDKYEYRLKFLPYCTQK